MRRPSALSERSTKPAGESSSAERMGASLDSGGGHGARPAHAGAGRRRHAHEPPLSLGSAPFPHFAPPRRPLRPLRLSLPAPSAARRPGWMTTPQRRVVTVPDCVIAVAEGGAVVDTGCVRCALPRRAATAPPASAHGSSARRRLLAQAPSPSPPVPLLRPAGTVGPSPPHLPSVRPASWPRRRRSRQSELYDAVWVGRAATLVPNKAPHCAMPSHAGPNTRFRLLVSCVAFKLLR